MNRYNIRPAPKLIDPSLLGRVNKVYIGKTNENNFILDWLYKTIYPHFRDNFLFTIIVLFLIGYLIYRFLETIKKKNRIINNINDDKPIEVAKLGKPIDYDTKAKKENFNSKDDIELSELSELTNLSEQENIVFDKDVERGLQMGDNSHRNLNDLPPELVRQQIMHQQMNQQNMNQTKENIVDTSMNLLQKNMNQMNDPNNGSCSVSFKSTSLYEPMAMNNYSDNFMNFNEM